jgi:hypothetical protein
MLGSEGIMQRNLRIREGEDTARKLLCLRRRLKP